MSFGQMLPFAPSRSARWALLSKIRIDGPAGCWFWTGAQKRNGYGNVKVAGRNHVAHAITYAWTGLPPPTRRRPLLDHTCRVRACVNPFHLEPVSHARNTLRGNGPTAAQHRRTCKECRRCR